MARKQKNKGIVLVKKSNRLIESRYKFDIWETRIFLSVLAQIRRGDEDFKPYRIWYKDVIKTFGLKSGQSYSFLRDGARSLMRKVFNVSSYEDGFRRETEYHIIRTVNYLSEGSKGQHVENQEYIDITVEPEMKPFLLQLQKNYTAYDLRNIVKLGAYHVRIYELLKQYETIGHRTLQIEEIKRILEITTEYPLFANFFQKIVNPSVKAINRHTDLTITKLEKLKKGRRVVALYFEFRAKDRLKIEQTQASRRVGEVRSITKLESAESQTPAPKVAEKDRLFELFHEVVVRKFGVTPSVFLELLEQVKEKEIHQAIRVTRRAKANGQIKVNVAGFFVNALKNGYTDVKEEANKRRLEREAAQKLIDQKIETLQAELAYKINEKIKELVIKQPNITEKAILELKSIPAKKMVIDKKERELERLLVIEDFRQDRTLREMVKLQIMEISKADFAEMLKAYKAEITRLK